jgi:hypothetical protein
MNVLHVAKRWMSRHGRPGGAARLANRVQAIATPSGSGVKHVAVLEVPVRRTGQLRSFPVVVADYRGERYLVAMRGAQTNWIRNVDAANGRVALRHGQSEPVRLELVEPTDRAEILRRYLELAPGARPHIAVDRHAPLEEFDRIAAAYPVYRIHAAAGA